KLPLPRSDQSWPPDVAGLRRGHVHGGRGAQQRPRLHDHCDSDNDERAEQGSHLHCACARASGCADEAVYGNHYCQPRTTIEYCRTPTSNRSFPSVTSNARGSSAGVGASGDPISTELTVLPAGTSTDTVKLVGVTTNPCRPRTPMKFVRCRMVSPLTVVASRCTL